MTEKRRTEMERQVVEKELSSLIELTLRMEDDLNHLIKPEND